MATCHECGAEMVRDIRPLEFTYKGRSLTVQQPGWYCACGEGVLTPEDSAATQAEYVAFRDQVDGILSPVEVRRIRKRLGLQQKRAGVVLGGGVSAFGKYERKDGKPSLAMSNLLRLLDKDPERLQEIMPQDNHA
jgi:HTH-type transcriptional regulator / antitoxin MqsA